MRNEMAVATISMAFKPGYRLTLVLGSDEEGQYLRAEDSLEVTWPERRISLRARTEELIDFSPDRKESLWSISTRMRMSGPILGAFSSRLDVGKGGPRKRSSRPELSGNGSPVRGM